MFKAKIESLSILNQKLLAYYGHWLQDPLERKALAISGTDEYQAIRQSLFMMLIILEKDNPEDILQALTQPYSEGDAPYTFHYAGIAFTAENRKPCLDNIVALLKMRNDLRTQLGDDADSQLIGLFLHHDLGKIRAFLLQHRIVNPEQMSPASHDLYLQMYLSRLENKQLAAAFKSAESWINIFDGLGCNPTKLAFPGYTSTLLVVEQCLDHLRELNSVNTDNAGNQIEALNGFLFAKAKSSQLNLAAFNFLVDPQTNRTPWARLDFEQQKNIALLLLCCPFIFVKPPLNTQRVTSEFISFWNKAEYSAIVQQMTAFVIDNKTNPAAVLLYNITGLIHHKPDQNGSHFANGGSVEDLFTVFFPFVLETVRNTSPEPVAARSFNPYQVLQGIEITAETLQCLLQNGTANHAAINFASPAMKEAYLSRLAQHKAQDSALVAHSMFAPAVVTDTSTAAAAATVLSRI